MLCGVGRTEPGSTFGKRMGSALMLGRTAFSAKNFKRFLANRAGSTSTVFIMTLLPTVAAVGMMTDYGRAYSVKNQMTIALDAAVLAGGRTLDATGSIDQAIKTARGSFVKMLPKNMTATITTLKPEASGKVSMAATSAVKTVFLGAVGIPTLDVVSSVQSSVANTVVPTNLEIALVMDTTSSMTGAKLANAKAAATALVNTLLPVSGLGASSVRISLVPFSDNVNVGTIAMVNAVTGVTNPPQTSYSCPTSTTVATPVSPPPACTKQHGFDTHGKDAEGYDNHGYNCSGFDRDGFDQNGYDIDGRDKYDRDHWGYDEQHHYIDRSAISASTPVNHTPRLNGDQNAQNIGCSASQEGGNAADRYHGGQQNNEEGDMCHGGDHGNGHEQSRDDDNDSGNPMGFQADNISFNWNGRDQHGYDQFGYDVNGKDHNGHDKYGQDENGRDCHHLDANGLDDGQQSGDEGKVRDVEGLDQDGYDKDGFDKHGCDHSGKDHYGNTSPAGINPKAPGISCSNTASNPMTTKTVITPKTCTAQSYLTTCMSERLAASGHAYDDAAPSSSSYFHAFTTTTAANWNCPSPAAPVTPLSNNAATLNAAIAAWAVPPVGTGAGHVGMAWGWYTVSQNWSSFWKTNASVASAPAAAAGNVKKIVIFVTDSGFSAHYDNNFMEVFDASSPTPATGNGTSASQTQQICSKMNAAGVEVFTVGVELNSVSQAVLNSCSTPMSAANAIQVAHNIVVANNADVNTGLVASMQALATRIAAATGTGSMVLRTTQ